MSDRHSACHIGIDLGTSGCRAIAIDAANRVVGNTQTALPDPIRSHDGGSTQPPDLWWDALNAVLGELLAQLDGRFAARSLALDATATSLLVSDRAGTPLGPALMYDDRRALAQAARLRDIAPLDAPVHGPSSSLAKVLYLLDTDPPPGAARVLHQADWLLGKMTGRFDLSDWNNALRLGFDPAIEDWPAWISQLDLRPLELPRVLPPGTPIGRVRHTWADSLGLPKDLWICAGTTDSTAAVLAAGVHRPGDAVSVLGSTLVLKVLSPRPVNAAEFGVYSHRIGDLWLVGGASNCGGAILRRFFTDQALRAMAQRLNLRHETGLDYYPLTRPGERFPVNDPHLEPRLTPRPDDDLVFFQGILEGLSAIEADGYALLNRLGAPAARHVSSIGGGAENTAWQRMRARKLGIPVRRAEQQAAAYGAALLGKTGLAQISARP